MEKLYSKSFPVIIDNDVFIDAYSTILKVVTIRKEDVIAAGSVMNKNIPFMELWVESGTISYRFKINSRCINNY